MDRKNVDYYMSLDIIAKANLGKTQIEVIRGALQYHIAKQIPEEEILEFLLSWFDD